MLRELVASAKCVLFDFDGPVARLFAGYPAADVAGVLKRQLIDWGLKAPDAPDVDDPLRVLRDSMGLGRDRELEELLTKHELKAVKSAIPTAYADKLVRLLSAKGSSVAVTTNNSPLVAERYLDGRGLRECFGSHIHGRTGDPGLMKPDPSCLIRALRSTETTPAECLMIGDSADDFIAAHKVGVTFLGYGRDAEKMANLYDAGASHVVSSLEDVCRAVSDG
ncbi:HAD family hydrolase [Actinacidiphila soli]|uniref:HAD family hydrolase n=1 Tax=Actinacidiphila soli TaxID=2487275 RepID=UPI001F0C2C3B|nr:HAD family hydrolase [Actinacidiphila soli]